MKRLRISDNRRFLMDEDGAPFFYLGDTAWQLFRRLCREDAGQYLSDRAAKGFNVIQATLVAEFGGAGGVNAYGDTPFESGDVTRPAEGFFRNVDQVLDRGTELGLYFTLLPCWGEYVNNRPGHPATRLFDRTSAEAYGHFLGARYGDRPNVLWVLGGDSRPGDDDERAIWRAMASGIRRGCAEASGYSPLLTYHPPGGTFRPPATSSGEFFHGEEWLDFHMIQSGHRRGNRNYERIGEDWLREPPKPTMEAEPCYEDAPELHDPKRGRFDDWDVRQRAYWGVFAGGAGHAYGHTSIWQFYVPGESDDERARAHWRDALDAPGAAQMRHLRTLMESKRPFFTRMPDQGILASDPGDGDGHVRATRDAGGAYALVYTPLGLPVTVDTRLAVAAATVVASWFDPRTGETQPIGRFASDGAREFAPPTSGRGEDWVLMLEGASGPV